MSTAPPVAKKPRWTYDSPCLYMEHTDRSTPSVEVGTESTKADVVLIALYAQARSITKSRVSMMVPDLIVQEALVNVAEEFNSSFAEGKKPGVATPMLRLMLQEGDGSSTTKRYALLGLGEKHPTTTEG